MLVEQGSSCDVMYVEIYIKLGMEPKLQPCLIWNFQGFVKPTQNSKGTLNNCQRKVLGNSM